MATVTYDPSDVVVTFGSIISGFADGTFVKISRNEDAMTLTVGADGLGARARNNNKSGTITITLMQTSQSNEILSGLAIDDELTASGVLPVLVKDKNGQTLAMGASGWIKKIPDVEFSKDIATREWVIEVEKLNLFVAGNGGTGIF